ncbi:cellulase family glycosylhydrolase [Cellvibrio japonicus]|uniref:Endoglucanase n=1 Tax=Cellvibrio japonicus (strain Ueda107) TaxID=498211 RepID=B3PF23_CELJU|nr:cellulase family glycosylhydrolase [Cellvibrio japonicus]ACE83841.1 cellulase, putative, cel5E [Cellvibrio japonicus Ueda107]QEI13582.1 cellulase family glycosylhydrolase [Cellvibrio japonicus]QEI17156.1 cellulase family glycosylhydrolase [Cellvibrio japonicus]QEI20733.1 cellulase family glycosylhydrolase [Cellvibrio japonicus]
MMNHKLKAIGLAALLGLGLTGGAWAQTASCKYVVTNSWGSGATAAIEITNTGTSAINGWSVSWQYTNNRVTNSWNATVSGSNPYSATNLGWNAGIQPGQTVSFGLQVNANGSVETPAVTGSICGGTTSSVSSSRSSSSQPSSSSSSSVSSSVVPSSISSRSSSSSLASSSQASACAQQCNWYGTRYPLCNTTTSGWGWENSQSCIAPSTCSGQPSPFGIVAGNNCPTSSSSSSLVVSSSSSSSSVRSSSSSSSSSVNSSSGSSLTSVELTRLMGVGWNVGNTLDAIGGETNWGNPLITQQLISSVKAAGFKTLRVPVAWSKFTNAATFTIDPAWLNRVEQVVNYALNEDMYVMINIHWDGGWMQPTYAQQAYVNNRLSIMWTQIANHFRNYGDKLLFAGTNEVMVEGDYGTPTVEYYTVQNSFNQTFVDTVRATGGNNANRFLVVQGFNTNIDHTVNFARIPTDSASNRLLMEVHYYDPYNFTLNTSSNITQWGAIATNPAVTETWANEAYADAQFEKMRTNFINRGVGVILGEYGVVSRLNVSGHETFRVYYNQYITKSAYQRGLVPVYWDNGYSGDGGFALFDRNSGNQLYPDIIRAIVNATF